MFDHLIGIIVEFAALFKFWIILEPFEEGVQTRLGKTRKVVGPGLHWLAPFRIDHVFAESVVPRTHDLGNESVTTKDGKSAGFRAIVTFRIKDIEKAIMSVHEVEHAVSDACSGEIGHVLRENSWDDILHGEDITDKLTAACRKRGHRWGIEVLGVQLASLSLVKTIRLMSK